MGVYAQAIAPGLAWAPAGDAEAAAWRERFVFWVANSSGLPAADRANPAVASPLPAGMGEPARAVDGDPGTSWRPGPAGGMVVDLGAEQAVGAVALTWTRRSRPATVVETSVDGVTYARCTGPAAARYVAVAVPGWCSGGPELVELAVTAG